MPLNLPHGILHGDPNRKLLHQEASRRMRMKNSTYGRMWLLMKGCLTTQLWTQCWLPIIAQSRLHYRFLFRKNNLLLRPYIPLLHQKMIQGIDAWVQNLILRPNRISILGNTSEIWTTILRRSSVPMALTMTLELLRRCLLLWGMIDSMMFYQARWKRLLA